MKENFMNFFLLMTTNWVKNEKSLFFRDVLARVVQGRSDMV
jgi:hypothetical protein